MSRPGLARICILLASAALASAALTACGTSAPMARWYRPSAVGTGSDARARFVAGAVALEAEEIAGSARANLMREVSGVEGDPFSVTRDGEPVFRTFELVISNHGATPISYSPSFTRLDVGHMHRYPLGYSELYNLLRTALSSDGAVGRCASLFAETPVTIAAGTTLTRLLVFTRVEPGDRDVVLDVSGVGLGERDVATRMEFTRSLPVTP